MKYIRLFIVIMIGFLLVLSACQKDKTTSIKLGEVTRSVFYAPQYVALEKGFFADEGLDVDMQTTWGGDKTMTALLSDSVDIALVGSETSIYVYAQNPRDYAINFAQLTQTDGTFLVSKEAHDDFDWDNVKDTTFLGQRKGGMPQMVGEFVLKKYDIDPHSDLNLLQNIAFANIPGAFVSDDETEFVQLFEPTASTMEKEGTGHIVASFGAESGLVPYTVFMAKHRDLDDIEDNITERTKASHKSQQWADEHDPDDIPEVVQPYLDDPYFEILTASIARYKDKDSVVTDSIVATDGSENLKDIMEEAGA